MSAAAQSPERTAFAQALAAAITARGLTLERLSHRLEAAGTPTSTATLSYWQTGRSLPTRATSLRALGVLEGILRLDPGDLLGTLPSDTLSRWDPIDAVMPEKDLVAQVLTQMGLDPEQRMHTFVMHDSVVVAADRASQRATTRQVVQPVKGPTDRMALVFRQNDLDEDPPFIEGGSDCTLGQVVELADAGLVAAELRLPRPLPPDRLAMVSYHVTWDIRREQSPGFNRALGSDLDYAILEVSFEGEAPRRVEHLMIPNTTDVAQATDRVDTVLQPGRYVQHVLVDPKPGMHGISWAY